MRVRVQGLRRMGGQTVLLTFEGRTESEGGRNGFIAFQRPTVSSEDKLGGVAGAGKGEKR